MKTGMDKIAAQFMVENPGITIVNEVFGADHVTVRQARDAAGNLPDVFVTGSYGEKALKSYIEAGKIVDVTSLKVVQSLSASAKEGLKFADGNIYNVPFASIPMGTLYNRELFTKAGITSVPTTFSEFKEAVSKLEAIGVVPFVVAAKDGWPIGSQIWVPRPSIRMHRRFSISSTLSANIRCQMRWKPIT
jgi:raffinose/stachyose/melibiose transport system substrate-binding protein